MTRPRPSAIPEWPQPFDPATELDWGVPDISRRLLLEHLDQEHDGASRRTTLIDAHVRRLVRLLPAAPARLLDAGCGPGLYSVRLAQLGYDVTGVDVGDAVLDHGRREAKRAGVRVDFRRDELRALAPPREGGLWDSVLLIYFVLDGFSRRDQLQVLRRLRTQLRPGGQLIAELRIRPDQPPGRVTTWDVVERSLLSDTRHLLLVDTIYDDRNHTYILRETAVFDDGTVAAQQTTSRLFTLDEVAAVFGRCGFRVSAIYDEWTRFRATGLSESLLVVAEASR